MFLWEQGDTAGNRFWFVFVFVFGGDAYSRVRGTGPSCNVRVPSMTCSCVGNRSEQLGGQTSCVSWWVCSCPVWDGLFSVFSAGGIFSTSTDLVSFFAGALRRLHCPVNPVYYSSVTFYRCCLLLGKVSGFGCWVGWTVLHVRLCGIVPSCWVVYLWWYSGRVLGARPG